MTTTVTFEDVKPLIDSLSDDDKLKLVNLYRNDWGLPSRTREEFRQQGGPFTKEEEEMIDRLESAQSNH